MRHNIIPAQQAGTLYGLLRERTIRSADAAALMQYDRAADDWVTLTWTQVLKRTDRVAGAFQSLGLQAGDRVALFLQNCVDWVCFDMAAHKLGLPVVPLYTNDATANTAFLLEDSRPRVVLVDSLARWEAIAADMSDTSFVDQVWIHDPSFDPDDRMPMCTGFENVLERSGDTPTQPHTDPDAPAALVYTSGTTGAPKGAILTHRALLQNAEGVAKVFPPHEEDTFLSVLPLAHGFERTMGYNLAIMGGATIAYAQSLLRLRQDFSTIRPTVLMGVPRLYESIYDSARRAADASPARRVLFDMTTRIGYQRFAAGNGIGPGPNPLENMLWPLLDRFVARKVSAAFGGRLRVAVSGGANFPPEISRALIGLGVPMVEGYGLTEAGPVVTASECKDYIPGTVGAALPGIEVKKTDKGEMLLRSPGCMSGYWHREAETAALIDSDGWMRTGDLVDIDGDRITIAGRLKHILVMSNGENVNPVPIETLLEADPLVQQVCVVGDGRSFLSALIVLNKEAWKDFCKTNGFEPASPNDPKTLKAVMSRIKARLADLPTYQQVRACYATLDEWTVERKLLTPTLKIRRERVIDAYSDDIAALYNSR